MIRSIQERTGGFTEFVLLPFIHENAPIYLAGLARPGPTRRENRAVHAVSRLLLHGAIDSIQCSWVKLGDEGCRDVLQGGVNDLGGTLMEETISRMAGADHGSYKTISGLRAIAEPLGRPLRQRTTTYGEVRRNGAPPRPPPTASARPSGSGLPLPHAGKDEVARVARRAGPGLLGGVPDGDRAHRPPSVRQVHRPGRDVLAEQGARDPRRAEPFDGQRDEQVLHRRAHRDDEHGLLRTGPPLVGIVVRRVGDQARHHDQRRLPERSAAPDPAADLLLGEPVAAQVGDPGLAHRVEQGRVRAAAVPRITNRHGSLWCGAGAVSAVATARRTAPASTGSAVNARMVRRASGTSAEPNRNMSSSAGLMMARAPGPSGSVTSPARPRTTATGTCRDLPLTRSAAEAISSATAATVTSRMLPNVSGSPRWSRSGLTPAAPMALSVCPARHGRPIVSVTSTPRLSAGAAVQRLA